MRAQAPAFEDARESKPKRSCNEQLMNFHEGKWSVLAIRGTALAATSLVLLLSLLFSAPPARAQQYRLAWSTAESGSGKLASGRYSLSGTVGQPDGSKLSGGQYSLSTGFQRIILAIQSQGSPRLTITRSGANVSVSWPSPSTGFVLQQSENVANTNGWSSFTGTVSDNGTTKSISVPAGPGNQFYRLKQ